MSLKEQIEYHGQRAMKELDRGLIAKTIPAARAHLRLSSLHLERLRALQGNVPGRAPILIM